MPAQPLALVAAVPVEEAGFQQALDLILPLVRRFCATDGRIEWKPPVASSTQERSHLSESSRSTRLHGSS